jgi:hypothetical protein
MMRYAPLFLIGTLVFTASCSDETGTTGPTTAGTMTAAAATVTNEVLVNESFGFSGYSPCAVGAEFVEFTGFFSGTVHYTINGNMVAGHINGVARLTGEAQSTGTKYEYINAIANPFTESLVNGQASFSFVGKTAIIAQGQDEDWFVSPVFHATINAKGEVTVEVERYEEVCK